LCGDLDGDYKQRCCASRLVEEETLDGFGLSGPMDSMSNITAPDGSDADDNFKITFRVTEFVAKLDDGRQIHCPKQDVVWQQVNIRGITLEKLKSRLSESIFYGSRQEVHLFCEDKASGGVDGMIQNASELLVAFMDRWESKQLFILAKVVDFANIPSSAASQCSIISTAEISNYLQKDDNVEGGDSSDVNIDHLPIVDWSTIEIAAIEDGSMDAPISQEKMCLALGINENSILHPPSPIVGCVVDKEMLAEAAIAVDDNMPEELNISYDIDHPTIEVGTMFPSMTDCRMAIRQFAINEEFDLGTKKADRTRWSGECLADGCPWTITARVMADKKTTRINQIVGPHNCYSSSQVTSSMASQAWVKQRSIKILRKEPNIGAKALREKLQESYNVQMGYHTVWKGKEKALDEVFGTWGNSFQFLFNFKAEMEKRDPGSIVEVDTIVDDAGKICFHRFFMALRPCIDGFIAGCRPYLSIDSTALNGK